MEKNVGGYDRVLRLVFGPVLIVAALAIYLEALVVAGLPGAALVVAGPFVGGLLVVTGAIPKSPIYQLFGIDTDRRTATEESPDETGVGRAN